MARPVERKPSLVKRIKGSHKVRRFLGWARRFGKDNKSTESQTTAIRGGAAGGIRDKKKAA
ncbi:MAG: hypothetical protein ABIH20_00010 [Candidatus Diapherotrites archaeon]